MGRILKGYWDCPQCGNKGIDGGADTCPNCGRRKDSSVTHYLDLNQKVEAKPEERAAAVAGANWICEYCDGANRAGRQTCSSCGAARSEKKAPGYQQVYRSNEEFHTSSAVPPDAGRRYDTRPGRRPQKKRKSKVSSYLGCGLAFILLFFLFGFFTRPPEPSFIKLHIENYLWEREIQVEEQQTFQESDWSLPGGARLTDTTRSVHHYDQIFDHYETRYRTVQVVDRYETEYKTVEVFDCYKTEYRNVEVFDGYDTVPDGVKDLGNGYFEEMTRQVPRYRMDSEPYQVPVYKTVQEPYQVPVYKSVQEPYQDAVYNREPVYQNKYSYEIDRYVYSRSSTSSGTDTDPYWQEPVLEQLEKESGRLETYQITTTQKIKQELKTATYELSYHEWKALRDAETRDIEVEFSFGSTLTIIKPELVYDEILQSQSIAGNSGDSEGMAIPEADNYPAKTNPVPAQTDGAAVSEGSWQQEGEYWGFTDAQGQPVANRWVQEDDRWYFIDQTGIMVTGWMMVDGDWYLMDDGGGMLTGWNYVNEQWYCLDDSGALLTDTTTPDGYRVGQNGEWVE